MIIIEDVEDIQLWRLWKRLFYVGADSIPLAEAYGAAGCIGQNRHGSESVHYRISCICISRLDVMSRSF